MKRLSLAIILACCTLAVAAQEGIQVKCQGAKPTIRDFAQAYLYALFNPEDGEEPEGDGLYLYESLQQAIASQDKKLPLKKGTTLTIDLRGRSSTHHVHARSTRPRDDERISRSDPKTHAGSHLRATDIPLPVLRSRAASVVWHPPVRCTRHRR